MARGIQSYAKALTANLPKTRPVTKSAYSNGRSPVASATSDSANSKSGRSATASNANHGSKSTNGNSQKKSHNDSVSSNRSTGSGNRARNRRSDHEALRSFDKCLCLQRGELPAPYNGYNTELCIYKMNRWHCPHQGHCQWAHSVEALVYTEDEMKLSEVRGYKSRTCRKDVCKLGEKCFFRHDTERHRQMIENMYLRPVPMR